jgi:hypothetical protein
MTPPTLLKRQLGSRRLLDYQVELERKAVLVSAAQRNWDVASTLPDRTCSHWPYASAPDAAHKGPRPAGDVIACGSVLQRKCRAGMHGLDHDAACRFNPSPIRLAVWRLT